jgi:hypothetical protein
VLQLKSTSRVGVHVDASNVYRNGGSRLRYDDSHLPPDARSEDLLSCHIIFELRLAPLSRHEGSYEAVAIESASRLPGRI